MIWLTWRQHRRQLLASVAGLVALAAVLVPTGIAMHHAFERLGLAQCLSAAATAGCPKKFDDFTNAYGTFVFLAVLLLVLPLLIGIFWGAPVVAREVEQGTHRMVWTQGITRRRWILTKVSLLGAAVTVFALLYGLGTAWWWEPMSRIDSDQSRFGAVFFDLQGIAPVGYTLFAVALGIAAGTAIPKVVPAMGVTLAGFIVVRVAVAIAARPRFMRPETSEWLVASGPGRRREAGAGSWIMSTTVHQVDGTYVMDGTMRCPLPADGGCQSDNDFGVRAGAYNLDTFQPADRYWTFQAIETAIFVLLAALLILWTVRRLRRVF